MEILNHKDAKKVKEILEETYGLVLEGLFLRTGKNKIRYFKSNLTLKEFSQLKDKIPIDTVGIYLGKLFDDGFRLSFDAVHLFQNKISKNIIEISLDDMRKWFNGENLSTKKDTKGFFVIKHKDIIGCAKVSNNIIYNYVPREKRIVKI